MRRAWLEKLAATNARRSMRFRRFLATPAADGLAAAMTAAAAAGAGFGFWRGEWIDAVVRLVLALAIGSWLLARTDGRHGGPPRAAL